MPTDDHPPETFHVTTDEQLRAVSNLTRHRIMAVLRFEPATITQIAERVGLAKGSSSYHVRLLERAGLIKVVRTRKVRGGSPSGITRWPHGPSGCRPGRGRNGCADASRGGRPGGVTGRWRAARTDGPSAAHRRAVRGAGDAAERLADEFRELSDPPALPDTSLVFALFRPPAPVKNSEGEAK